MERGGQEVRQEQGHHGKEVDKDYEKRWRGGEESEKRNRLRRNDGSGGETRWRK